MGYTDLHSHVAWDIDDGIESAQEARKALSMAREDGIHRILSTPHVIPGRTTQKEAQDFFLRQKELEAMAEEFGIEIFKGGEIRLNNQFLNALHEGWLPMIHQGPYMLVEFSLREDFSKIELDHDLLYELKVRKITPVIAHVERYFHKALDWDVLDAWKEAGYIFQINATSLLGLDTPQSRKNAWALLKNGYAHVVATDAHRTEGSRIENLSDAAALVEKKLGAQAVQLLFSDNPDAILDGSPVQDLPASSRGFFSLFKR